MDCAHLSTRCTSPKLPPLVLFAAACCWMAATAFAADGDKVLHTSAAASISAAEGVDSLDARLDDLIQQLGSPQFTTRRAAANEIRRIGPEAFDKLHSATENSDPEIAASANYLLRQIAVRWTRGDDTSSVKRLMRGYGDRKDDDRRRIVQMLAGLPENEGVGGLCRVARFDRSPLLARLAAMAVIQSDLDSARGADSPQIDPAIFDRELGESRREASRWLRQYQLQLRDPAASVAGWQQLIDEEAKRTNVDVEETSPAIVTAMMWNLADVHRRLGQTEPLLAVLDRMLATGDSDSEKLLGTFLQWFVEHESWDALQQFATAHDDEIQKSKRTLYLLAMARTKQNDNAAAEALAARAAEIEPAKPFDGLNAAQLLVELGQYDWAVREYKAGFEGQPIDSVIAIGSRVELAELLRDYENYREAADAIGPLVDAMQNGSDVKRTYEGALAELAEQNSFLPEVDMLFARSHYLEACHYAQQHDYEREREHLLKAIGHDETDADVLIAMYRVGNADDMWMADTRKRIQALAKAIEEQIDDNPSSAIPYNQWAWLIANTEGDFAKAVRFSRRSLEIAPGTPSFLDTLGRCYYSAGDVENAVKSQRAAVALIPHMQVMQRQLKEFEKALAAKEKGPGVGGQGAVKKD
jgi:tetratricopeptide (TPR) repeat protein